MIADHLARCTWDWRWRKRGSKVGHLFNRAYVRPTSLCGSIRSSTYLDTDVDYVTLPVWQAGEPDRAECERCQRQFERHGELESSAARKRSELEADATRFAMSGIPPLLNPFGRKPHHMSNVDIIVPETGLKMSGSDEPLEINKMAFKDWKPFTVITKGSFVNNKKEVQESCYVVLQPGFQTLFQPFEGNLKECEKECEDLNQRIQASLINYIDSIDPNARSGKVVPVAPSKITHKPKLPDFVLGGAGDSPCPVHGEESE